MSTITTSIEEIAGALTIREQAAMILDGDQEALVELRAVHPRLGQVRQDWYTLDRLDDLERYASILAPSYDTWLGAAARARRGGAKEDVAFGALVRADCDNAAAVTALEAFEPQPTLVARTSTLDDEGEHRQAWWRLDRRLGIEQLEAVLRRIRAALGSDPRVCDAPRILRAIGTTNHKRSAPERIEVISFTGEVHDAEALLRALPADPGQADGDRRAGGGTMAVPARPLAEGEGRHAHLCDFAIRLVRSGVLDEARIVAHLKLEFSLSCEPTPPPKPGALEAIARWAVRTRIACRERERAARERAGSWWSGCVMRGGGGD